MTKSNQSGSNGKKRRRVSVWDKEVVISSLVSDLNLGLEEALRHMSSAEIKQVQARIKMSKGLLMADFLSHIFELHETKRKNEARIIAEAEYKALTRRELDLESLLHITLEFLLEKVGPTNAAIFLPVTSDEFTLGGYVSYDSSDGNPEILLGLLAEVVAPRMVNEHEFLHLSDDQSIADWVGYDSFFPEENSLLAVTCLTEEAEPLAVIVFFRSKGEPYTNIKVEEVRAVAPLFAQYLARIVRVHHRHLHN